MMDAIQRFLIENRHIRGEIVLLQRTVQDILDKQPYTPEVAAVLAEASVAALLLSGTIKSRGSTAIQAKGSGPVTMLMAEATDQRTVRGIARVTEQSAPATLSTQTDTPPPSGRANTDADLKKLLGQDGVLVITLTPHAGKRYQGIVPLEGKTLSHCLEGYFARSEQLPTCIRIFHHEGTWAGLLLQQLPATEAQKKAPDQRKEDWLHALALGETLSAEEILTLPIPTVLHRLFHEESVRLFDPQPASFWCSCSEERTMETLKSLGKATLDEILSERGRVEVDCQFCHQHYSFDQFQVSRLFDEPTRH